MSYLDTTLKTIILITGLPGSGKTYLGMSLLKKYRSQERVSIFFDDIGIKFTLDDLFCAMDKKYDIIIVSDPNLCDPSNRNKALQFFNKHHNLYFIKWMFFENSSEKCIKNVSFRDDGRLVINTIKDLSKIYYIPPDSEVLQIWQEART